MDITSKSLGKKANISDINHEIDNSDSGVPLDSSLNTSVPTIGKKPNAPEIESLKKNWNEVINEQKQYIIDKKLLIEEMQLLINELKNFLSDSEGIDFTNKLGDISTALGKISDTSNHQIANFENLRREINNLLLTKDLKPDFIGKLNFLNDRLQQLLNSSNLQAIPANAVIPANPVILPNQDIAGNRVIQANQVNAPIVIDKDNLNPARIADQLVDREKTLLTASSAEEISDKFSQ